MIRFNYIITAAIISLLALTGCDNAPKSVSETSPAASPVSGVDAGSKTSKTGFDNLLGVVSNAKTAVQSGDFAKAKTEFDKFEGFWKQVEDGVKAKSPENYDSIEKSLDEVTADLKGSKPSQEKVIGALQSLEKSITVVSKL